MGTIFYLYYYYFLEGDVNIVVEYYSEYIENLVDDIKCLQYGSNHWH